MDFLFASLFFFFSSVVVASNCDGVPGFPASEKQRVRITVDRIFWVEKEGCRVQEMEEVCATSLPLEIQVSEIRGREEEWYRCFHRQAERPRLECETRTNGAPARLVVRPAIVIRSSQKDSAVRDSHAHIYLTPTKSPELTRDTFVRMMSPDLKKQSFILDSASPAEKPDEFFGVKIHFL